MIAVRTTRVTLTTATSRGLGSGMVWGVGGVGFRVQD